MSKQAEEQIRALVERFTKDLMKVVRDAAVRAFSSTFEFGDDDLARLGTGEAPAKGRPPLRHAARPRRDGAANARRRVTGGKRDPKRLDALTDKLAARVAQHPGETVLAIGQALGASTADLALPIRKLLAQKRLKKRGSRNNTRYYPGK